MDSAIGSTEVELSQKYALLALINAGSSYKSIHESKTGNYLA